MKLANKVALVTGASRGIGRAIAQRLAREGAEVIVHYNANHQAAEAVVDEIRAGGGKASRLHADITDIAALRRALGELAELYPTLDILVNNAGWATFKPTEAVMEEEFDALFGLNVRGLFFLTQEVVGRMNEGGRVVNISSGITRVNAAGGAVYAASKAAVEAFTRCWAAEFGARRITVNTVSPGMTETDLLMEVTPRQVLQDMVARTPLGRLGQPADIADVVAFLCSQEARWLTANNLLANGGVS